MNGEDFITAAGKLAAMAGSDEALLRSAVSRAYYGAFHCVLELINELGVVIHRNANAHGTAQRLLIGSHHPQAATAGGLLADLHADRIRADYRLEDDRYSRFEQVRLRVETATRVRQLVDDCRSEPVRAEVLTGIRAYQQRLK